MADDQFNIKYGKKFPKNWTNLNIECWSWANYDRFKAPELQRWEHLRNICGMVVPNFIATYNKWLEQMLIGYAENTYMAVMGCSNSGKTHTVHTLAFVDFLSDPLHTQVICTTTSLQGLKTRMWPILSGLYNSIKPAGWVKRVAPNMMIAADRNDTKHAIRAIPIQLGDVKKQTDNIIGVHTERVIWIVDEATSAPSAVFNAWSNLAGGTRHRRLIMLGNPEDQLDTFGQFCRPAAGWDSVDVNTEQWEFERETEKGLAIHLDGTKTPNLDFQPNKNGIDKFPFLFNRHDLIRHESSKEDKPFNYWRFCRGWYAEAGLIPRIVSMPELEKYKCFDDVVFQSTTTKIAALDPAFGGDRAILKIGEMGYEANSQVMKLRQLATYEVPVPPKSIVGQQIGEYVMEKAKEYGFKTIGIDTTTDNSSPADYLKLNSNLEVIECPFGNRPTDLPVSRLDNMPCSQRYDRLVTELWFGVKETLPQICMLDFSTAEELCARYFRRYGKPEKLALESKDEMKKRRSGKSPDLADAFAILCFVFKKLGGFDPPGFRNYNRTSKDKIRNRNSIWNQEHAYVG